jgi:P-type Ca2+ transporter type 2C
LPFDAERKCMTTIHSFKNSFISFTKGAPDIILSKCNFENDEDKIKLEEVIDDMASEGLRIIVLSYNIWKALPSDLSPAVIENRMTFVALTGISDPLRAESRSSVELCKTAGIKPIMITGDHAVTANIIAKQTASLKQIKIYCLHHQNWMK